MSLYAHGGRKRNLPKFEKRYGKEKGRKVYGAVVGKVRRERMAEGKCSVRGCAAPAAHFHGIHGCCDSRSHHAMLLRSHRRGTREGMAEPFEDLSRGVGSKGGEWGFA